jgi:hypothetical protein
MANDSIQTYKIEDLPTSTNRSRCHDKFLLHNLYIGCLVSDTNYKLQLLALEHCSIFWHLFSFGDFNVFFTTTFFYSLLDSELNPFHYPIIMHVLLTMLLTRKFRSKIQIH